MPSVTRISTALTLPGDESEAPLAEVVTTIDLVHGVIDAPTSPVVMEPVRDGEAFFEYSAATGTALRIVVDPQARHPQLSLVHEIGHFLDFSVLGVPGSFASATHLELDGWRDAVSASKALLSLDTLRQRQSHPGWLLIFADLMAYHELWARSYAQYIAVRSRNSSLVAQIDERRRHRDGRVYVSRQWDDSDFGAIAHEIDVLFRTIGWTK